MMWDVIPNKKGPIKMLTQKMQETITRFKKPPRSRRKKRCKNPEAIC